MRLTHTVTAMGGRLLRAWLQRPLHTTEPIHNRLDGVEEFAFRTIERTKLQETLKSVYDLERLVARIALRTAGPRDLVALKQSIAAIPLVRDLLKDLQAPLVKKPLRQTRRCRGRSRCHSGHPCRRPTRTSA